jgi:hypothetical protein
MIFIYRANNGVLKHPRYLEDMLNIAVGENTYTQNSTNVPSFQNISYYLRAPKTDSGQALSGKNDLNLPERMEQTFAD